MILFHHNDLEIGYGDNNPVQDLCQIKLLFVYYFCHISSFQDESKLTGVIPRLGIVIGLSGRY